MVCFWVVYAPDIRCRVAERGSQPHGAWPGAGFVPVLFGPNRSGAFLNFHLLLAEHNFLRFLDGSRHVPIKRPGWLFHQGRYERGGTVLIAGFVGLDVRLDHCLVRPQVSWPQPTDELLWNFTLRRPDSLGYQSVERDVETVRRQKWDGRVGGHWGADALSGLYQPVLIAAAHLQEVVRRLPKFSV